MNSCIYLSKIAHTRSNPKKNNFVYSIFLFYLDLDELELLANKHYLFSKNKWNLFSFYDNDHFKFINQDNKILDKISREKINYNIDKYKAKNTKERIQIMIEELNLDFELDKVFILTNLRLFGWVFNPVSFYYCFDKQGKFRVLFSEVNNTSYQQKMYYKYIDNPDKVAFTDKQKKNFYISPFIDYDTDLNWKFMIPGDKLYMKIDSLKVNKSDLQAILTGNKKEITNYSFLFLFFRYPFLTIMIIIMIHYQALKLWIKKIKFHNKEKTDKEIAETIDSKNMNK